MPPPRNLYAIRITGDAWERLPEPRPRLVLVLEVHSPEGTFHECSLGPHAARMRPQDLDLMHKIWLDVTSDPRFAGAHHYHLVGLALEELQRELNSERRTQLLNQLADELRRPHGDSTRANPGVRN